MRVQAIEKGIFPNVFVAYLILPCCHCENPPCVRVCPVDAILKRETDGIVVVDQEKCVGQDECGGPCLKACPWDAEKGQQTICVEACPMHALDAGPLQDLQAKYGDITEAEGYKYSKKFKPSMTFKPKLWDKDD
jgi:anaerobic dimethyl sulfoxide reductase subunit B (iron-sulfur subunit)